MVSLKRLLLILLVACNATMAMAQTTAANEAGVMRSNGKIYVVVVIVVTILLGLIIYVARLDRKITKLEKEKP